MIGFVPAVVTGNTTRWLARISSSPTEPGTTFNAIRTGHIVCSRGFSVTLPEPLAPCRSTTRVFRIQYWGNEAEAPASPVSSSSCTSGGGGGGLRCHGQCRWLQPARSVASATAPAASPQRAAPRALFRTPLRALSYAQFSTITVLPRAPWQRVTYANGVRDTPYGTVAISQFQALDRRESAPTQAACRQQAGFSGRRLRHHGGRRSERPQGLS